MPSDRAPRGGPHAFELIRGFDGATVVQEVERTGWIDALDTESLLRLVDLADQDAFVPFFREMTRDVIARMHHAHVELIGPVALRIRGWQVPIVLLLVIHEYRRFARRVDHVTMRRLRQWQPADKVRVWFEGIVVIVEKRGPWRTREYDGVIGSRPFERLVVAGLDCLDVVRVQLAEDGVVGVGCLAHLAIITGFRRQLECRKLASRAPSPEFQSTRKLGIIYGFREWPGDMYAAPDPFDAGGDG